jgi:hypothetical protein
MPTNSADVRLALRLGSNRAYELLARNDIGGPSEPLGTLSTTNAGVFDWTDTGAASGPGRRFYSVTVSHEGLSYTNEDVWAMFADERLANTKYLASIPLDYGVDNTLNSVLGAQLAWGMHAGSGTTDADMLQVLTPDKVWKEIYLLTNATGRALWWDIDLGAESDLRIEPGSGFWVVRKTAPAQSGTCGVLVSACYKAPPQFLVSVSNDGWNVIGPPAHWEMRHRNTEVAEKYSTPPNQLGFAGSGSSGTTADIRSPNQLGDQIWVWENNQWKGYYWLMGNLGPKWDGRWWDRVRNDFADFSLEPGKAFYYRHRVNQWGGTNFLWQGPSP